MKAKGAHRGRLAGGWQWTPLVIMLLPPAVVAFLVLHQRGGATADDIGVVGVVVALSVGVGVFWQTRFYQLRADKVAGAPPNRLSERQLRDWTAWLRAAVLQVRVDHGGVLDEMMGFGGVFELTARTASADARRSRIRVGGQLVPWTQLLKEAGPSNQRLVILGEPGYGKTVAALTMIAHLNDARRPDRRVAEMFSFADWFVWRADHGLEKGLVDWMAEQLTLTYDDLRLDVSRELFARDRILPILDGLDEIPTVEGRRAAADAIRAFARRGAPHRPFVVTCRVREYLELRPVWVTADREIVLDGLPRGEVSGILEHRRADRKQWQIVNQRLAAGDPTLGRLLASPLRLAIALRVYRDNGPSELLDLTLEEAKARLWERLLSGSGESFKRHSSDEIRVWLSFLAREMKRAGRQRFMLHELYLLDPHLRTSQRRFAIVAGLVFGTVLALILIGLGSLPGSAAVFGALFGAGVGWGLRRPGPAAIRAQGQRNTAARRAFDAVARAVRGGLWFGLVSGLVAGLVEGLVVGLVEGLPSGPAFGLGSAAGTGLTAVLSRGLIIAVADNGTVIIEGEPPKRFGHKRPDAVLTASRNMGLAVLLVVSVIVSMLVVAYAEAARHLLHESNVYGALGMISGFGERLAGGLPGGLGVGLLFGTVVGVVAGVGRLIGGAGLGLDAWLFHHWVRAQLHRRGLLPRGLPEFLSWCADPARGWLRITNAYEFRHQELLEHLALSPSLPGERVRLRHTPGDSPTAPESLKASRSSFSPWMLWGILSGGLLASVGFFLAAKRRPSTSLRLACLAYGVVAVATLTCLSIPADEKGQHAAHVVQTVGVYLFFGTWTISTLHAFWLDPTERVVANRNVGRCVGSWLALASCAMLVLGVVLAGVSDRPGGKSLEPAAAGSAMLVILGLGGLLAAGGLGIGRAIWRWRRGR